MELSTYTLNYFLAYFLAVLMGLALGVLGGGGAILTLPILVYIMHIPPYLAVSYSLLIVGFTALFGVYKHFKDGDIHFKHSLIFSIPSVISIYLSKIYIMPIIPHNIFGVNFQSILMIFFSILMLISALIMGKGSLQAVRQENSYTCLKLAIIAIVVGLISGFLGAGGGFIIVPALVLLMKMPLKNAVGTSLFIIMINSLLGSLTIFNLDHTFPALPITSFIFFAILGMYFASFIQNKTQSKSLQKYFSTFMMLISFFILIKETSHMYVLNTI